MAQPENNAPPATPLRRNFADLAVYSSTDKTAISVRDGILEYAGAELDPTGEAGLDPERIYTVYRSPATIANVAPDMIGIPLTGEHVDNDAPAPDTGSSVTHAEVIDVADEGTDTRLGVRNRLSVADSMIPMLQDRQELSLGYKADLVPHDRYDFEQVAILPHHLAAVPNGRCGSLCSFLDQKPIKPPQEGTEMTHSKLHLAFKDAEGSVSLEKIVEIATSLPEAIRQVPVDKLQEIMPSLMEVMSYAKENNAVPEGSEGDEDDPDKPDDPEAMEDENKPKFSDAQFQDAVKKRLEKEKQSFADAEVKKFAQVANKARDFLDEEYDFTGKSAKQIMRDCLATQHTESFEDAELDTAFKLLKKPREDYSNFGDSAGEGGLVDRVKAMSKKEG